jgi:hypothetical protein
MVDAPRHILEGTDRGDSQRSGTARGVPDSREGRCRTAHSSSAAHLPALAACSSAISANRHRALINRIYSIVRARDSSRRGLATMQARHIARETATLRRLREKRKARVRGTPSALEVARRIG